MGKRLAEIYTAGLFLYGGEDRRRMCFLSALVEVGASAFLAAELDDVAEGAIGGVADQPKTTATVGAPLHAILPSLQFCNPPKGHSNAASRCAFARCSHLRVSSMIRILILLTCGS